MFGKCKAEGPEERLRQLSIAEPFERAWPHQGISLNIKDCSADYKDPREYCLHFLTATQLITDSFAIMNC